VSNVSRPIQSHFSSDYSAIGRRGTLFPYLQKMAQCIPWPQIVYGRMGTIWRRNAGRL